MENNDEVNLTNTLDFMEHKSQFYGLKKSKVRRKLDLDSLK